jgi:hypothetical protein
MHAFDVLGHPVRRRIRPPAIEVAPERRERRPGDNRS